MDLSGIWLERDVTLIGKVEMLVVREWCCRKGLASVDRVEMILEELRCW